MQTSDTSALLATTALSKVAHWLWIIVCKAFWKPFVPPQAEARQSQNDTLLLNSEQGHQALYCLLPSTGQCAGWVRGASIDGIVQDFPHRQDKRKASTDSRREASLACDLPSLLSHSDAMHTGQGDSLSPTSVASTLKAVSLYILLLHTFDGLVLAQAIL
ncbi:hypothetical protein STEG23_024130 [Scotinomys teguina]